ncbi:MAG TPA: serine/threonine-protein kinase, partial [Kofleriaceae bacterium]|nr:serine/threonine-protein kinase [Kofleriaceae bacterium]
MIGRELQKRYRVLEKLGEGAMGEVYLVEHLGLRRQEAMKVLHAALGDAPDVVARFRREARASNRLEHGNIVGTHDFGRLPDGRFYLTLEYADGEALDMLLRRSGRFPIPRALHVLAQLADAVDHAHSRGVIHRDLKPANMILVERRGHADVLKVLDFGIAKIIAPDYTETVAATADGQVFGTPAYMAPEQVNGPGRDPRIDLYAIGCIAHELVTGDPPFTGKTIEVMNAHLTRPPTRPSERRREAGIPAELDAIVLRCLEKDPDRRFQTAREILTALRQVPGFPGDERNASGRRLRLQAPRLGDALPPGDDRRPTAGVGIPEPLAMAETLYGSIDQEVPEDEP